MGLRNKTLLAIGITMILMIGMIYSITNTILLGGYAKLERQDILQNADQAIKMIEDEIGHLKSIAGDWSPWDDTYQFVQDVNQAYIDDNLMDTTVVNLHVNFLIFINTDGKIVYGKYTDLETGKGGQCSDSLLGYLSANPFLFRSDARPEILGGLAIFTEDPVLLASAPILTSQNKGPAAGTLIVGRYLNSSEVNRLAEKVNLSIRLQRLDSDSLPHDFKMAKQSLSSEKKVAVIEFNDNSIGAFALLSDLSGKPVLMLGIDKDRRIFAQGKTSMRYFVLSLWVTGLVFIVATLVFIEITVLSRMVRLNREVKDIGATGNLFKKTSIHGKDELADLAHEINQMIESVRVSTERDRAILDSIEDGYFELDLKGKLIFHNQSLSRLLGYPSNDFGKINFQELLEKASAGKIVSSFKQLYETGRPIKTIETELVLEQDRKIYMESTVSLIKDINGKPMGFRGIARDVTERRKSSEKLIYMVYHDSLTGLLNRKAFHQHLEKELSHAERYKQQRSLLFIDLDKFKEVNDTYGHDVGDQLLKGFANRVEKILRKADMIYRLGGDEFAVFLTNPQEQTPAVVAQRIVDVMEEPFFIGSKTVDFVRVSIGISTYPIDAADAETLLQCADKAMYAAKRKGNHFTEYQGIGN